MKILKTLIITSLVFPMAHVAGFSQNNYNGKNGKNGRIGENGEDGEDGGFYGGDGGNGGNGGCQGNGGKGGNGGFFGGNGGNGGDGGSKENLPVNITSQQVDECEYKILKDACRIVIEKVEEHLSKSGNLNSTIAQQIFKSELSNYLLSLDTPAARKIHAEYEAVGWKYPAIKTI